MRSGYQLDDVALPKDKKFIGTVDVKLRDARITINNTMVASSMDQILDDDFNMLIRKISGCEQKINTGAFTFTKAAKEDMLGALRAIVGLVKVCRVFDQKKDANAIKASDCKALKMAFAAYRSNPRVKDYLRLPWCISQLELLSQADENDEPPANPVSVFPAQSTVANYNCTHVQWATFAEDLLTSKCEGVVKTYKGELDELKDFFCFKFRVEYPDTSLTIRKMLLEILAIGHS